MKLKPVTQSERAYWSSTPADVLRFLQTAEGGLTVEEALQRLKAGRNRIHKSHRIGRWKIFFDQLKSPLILLLIFAAIVTSVLHDIKNALFISFAVAVNTGLGFYQENKAESALAKLRTFIKERTRVVRGGRDIEIYAEEVVKGDIIKLNPGVRVPADAKIIRANRLSVDETILTGESLAVDKSAMPDRAEAELAERSSMVYGGTLVVDGIGLAVVVTTGSDTELGKIAALVSKADAELTPLQQAIIRFALRGSLVLIALTVLLFLFGSSRGETLLEMFLTSVAVAVSAVPEGLPVALTVILAVGVERLAQRRGVVRQLLAAETLGSTTLILTDKTGTLTEARMTLDKIISDKPEELVLELAILNTDVVIGNPAGKPCHWQLAGRPLEVAMVQAGIERGVLMPDVFRRNKVLEIKPFNSKEKISAVHAGSGGRSRWVFLGAPDYLLNLTDGSAEQKQELLNQVETLAYAGNRVLGLAVDNKFIALLSFKDPVRKGVKEIISEIKTAGIRTVILTGDHKGTAVAVAQELGWVISEGEVMTGADLRVLSDEVLRREMGRIKIFARVTPEDKFRITKLYQELGEVVAVTGDGVNDAPALKGANIGVAVGSGTDVAKESADLVILDDNFATIVEAINEGRRILDNIRKVLVYLLSSVLDELVLIGGSLLIGLPLPLSALQILWVNFFTDSFPAVTLAFEKEKGLFKKRPVKFAKSLFDSEMRFLIWVVGSITSGLLFFLYFYLASLGLDINLVKTFIFAAFSVYTLFMIFPLRSLRVSIFRYNPFGNLYLVLGASIGFLLTGLAIYLPALQNVLGTVPLSGTWLLGVLSFGLISVVAVELGKFLFHKKW